MSLLVFVSKVIDDPAVKQGYEIGYKIGSFLQQVFPYVFIVVLIIFLYKRFKKK